MNFEKDTITFKSNLSRYYQVSEIVRGERDHSYHQQRHVRVERENLLIAAGAQIPKSLRKVKYRSGIHNAIGEFIGNTLKQTLTGSISKMTETESFVRN